MIPTNEIDWEHLRRTDPERWARAVQVDYEREQREREAKLDAEFPPDTAAQAAEEKKKAEAWARVRPAPGEQQQENPEMRQAQAELDRFRAKIGHREMTNEEAREFSEIARRAGITLSPEFEGLLDAIARTLKEELAKRDERIARLEEHITGLASASRLVEIEQSLEAKIRASSANARRRYE